ncbi:MAG: protein kinase domain-containing protein [Planctomycetota bacterium]
MIGEILGAYRLVCELGAGGMGTVYLAEDGSGARLALKVVHPHLLRASTSRDRFLREGKIGRRIRHPNVVTTHGVEEIELNGKSALVLAMEYVEGQTLRRLLEDLGQVPEELCRHIAIEVSKALEAIHGEGVIHRDLKPENVLITPDHVVKVMDLGVARLADETVGLSQTGTFVGSVLYGAPEQFRSDEPDARADRYALGLVLYELSTGKHPFAGDDIGAVVRRHLEETARPPSLVNPQLTPFFEEVVLTLLAKDRGERFDSTASLREVLERGEQSEWWIERARSIRSATKQPLRRIRIPRETALYGRDSELDELRVLFGRAEAGEGQVLLIEGEAGIGKTRLVDEFVGLLRQEGRELNFLFGSYPPGGAATAAGAFSTAYREHFGSESLEETLGEYLKVTPGLIPAFAALLRGEATPRGEEPLGKDALQAVFVHATRALAEERPTVVLIDDLHFAPEEGRALFAALSLALQGHRIFLVGSSRPGLPEDWVADVERLDQCSWLGLSRLGPKDLAGLLMDAFGSERLAEELAYQIGTKSDGNPFFAFEIIRGLREGQFITQKPDGTWVKTQVIENIEIPATVMDLIQARIADLDDDQRNLLELASCCGYEFDPRIVGEALGMGRIPALQKLGRVEKSLRLVRSAGAKYLFDHHQVQEALYEGLSQPLREEYHAALAETLEAREHTDDQRGATAVELCRHLFLGGRGAKAGLYLGAALDQFEEGYLCDALIDLAQRALAEPGLLQGRERIEVLLRTRNALDSLGLREKEREVLDEAVALAADSGDAALRSRAEHELGGHLFRVSQYDEARTRFRKAFRLAREAGERRIEAQAMGSLGAISFNLGQFERARRFLARHRALAREIDDRRGEASATGNLGIALKNLGRSEEAREHLELHLALSKENGDRRGEAIATGNLGLVYSILGRSNQARSLFERCLSLSREIGFRHGEASATGNLGNALFELGLYDEAQAQHDRHLALCRETSDRRGEAIATGNLGVLSRTLGRYEDALAQFEAFLFFSRAIGDQRGEGLALDSLGRLWLTLGDLNASRRHLEKSLKVLRRIGARRSEGSVLHSLGALAEQEGDEGEAARLLGEALDLYRETEYRVGESGIRIALGRLAANRGQEEAAAAHLDQAHRLSIELDSPGMQLLAAARLALLPSGNAAAALDQLQETEARVGLAERMEASFLLWKATNETVHLERAHDLLVGLVENAPERCREAMLENVTLHREIVTAWECCESDPGAD